MSTIIVLEGVVSKVERSTLGYGNTERSVGIDVTVNTRFEEVDPADGSVSPYMRETKIHLPPGFTQPRVGQKMLVALEEWVENEVPFERPTISPEEQAEIAELAAADPDEDEEPMGEEVQGDPYHDEIKQGGA